MVFSSILFMFLYLPLALGIYFLSPKKWRNIALFVLNLAFYGWGEPIYILIMLLSTAVDYTHGLLVEKNKSIGNDKRARLWVCSSVAVNLGILIFFKYYDFIVTNLAVLFPEASFLAPLGIALPIGISFYTFQTMSYTIDVYRGDAKAQRNIATFGTFVTLFPQLIAGPIVKYKDVEHQLTNRRESVEQFAAGVQTFVVGLAKKALLANNIGPLWDAIKLSSQSDMSVLGAWLGIVAFGLQLYFDFSGYSDMAIGLGRMLGFEFKINFDYPYISKSVTEFWRRWHISLGSWFREYVYIPLGGNRKGIARTFINIFVVWALTGIWHGASWNFLIWGMYFAVLLMVEKAFLGKWLEKTPNVFRHIYCLFAIGISWALFAFDNFFAGLVYIKNMLFMGGVPFINDQFLYNVRNYGIILVVLLVACTPLAKNMYNKLSDRAKSLIVPALCLCGLIISTAYLVDASYNPFLYFRF